MDGKRKRSRWKKAAIIGGALLLLVLSLMAVGLATGRGDRGEETARVTRDGGNAADLLRDIEAGQSGADEPDKQYLDEPKETGAAAPRREALDVEVEESPAASGTGTVTYTPDVPAIQTRVIRTAALTLEIAEGEFNKVYSNVSLLAESVGGFVSDSRTDSSEGTISSGVVTVRVPDEKFGTVMTELKEMGTVTAVSEQSQDVTEEYVDLESRIRNLESQQSVYLNLMSRAETIEESISIQRELASIQEQIEQLKGRKNYLDNHVQYSTIQVTLLEPGAEPGSGNEGWGFVAALSDAAHGVVDGAGAVVKFFGYASVYIVLAIAVAAALYLLIRKRQRDKTAGEGDGGTV